MQIKPKLEPTNTAGDPVARGGMKLRGASLRPSKILLIDDESYAVEVLRRSLAQEGYQNIQSTTDPLAAVGLFEEFQPDLVVLDLLMPSRSGLEVLVELRALIPVDTYLPILVVTADPTIEKRRKALSCGATDFVSKPYDTTEVLTRIANLLETRRLHLQLATKQGALQSAIFNSANFSSIATDAQGVIQIFNVGAERMLGYAAAEVMDKITPAEISDPQELIARAKALSLAWETPIAPGFEALVFKASRGIEDIYELTYVRKDGSRFPAIVSVTALRDEQAGIIGYLLIGTDNTARKRSEQALEKAHKELVEASRQAGMAEVATSVLHNVGNVLNSVNISAGLIVEHLRKSRAPSLARVVDLLAEHAHDLGAFMADDARGRHLPAHLAQISQHLQADQEASVSELESLRRNVEHIKEIVAMQQNYATFGGVKEMIDLIELVEESLCMNEGSLNRHLVEVIREFGEVPPMNVEKHKILHILVNLLRNAKYVCQESARPDRRLTLRVAHKEGWVRIAVIDNGIGIPPENLDRIFNHGFTTRKDGHGFGLHSSALAAREMGGSLTVQSDGPGQGAVFTLELPCPAGENSHE